MRPVAARFAQGAQGGCLPPSACGLTPRGYLSNGEGQGL